MTRLSNSVATAFRASTAIQTVKRTISHPIAAFFATGACLAAIPAVPACTSTGIMLREQLGIAKREQLVDRVSEARDSQADAKEQFQSALDEFLSVTGQAGKPSELESKYRKLTSAYERSESRAATVGKRIDTVEAVGASLFREWNAELSQYTDSRLREQSEQQLRDSRARFDQLVGVMRSAESRMKPVLASLHNQVLFLKHNLNAQAVAGLQGTALEVENDLTGLIREMEAAIAEADRFIAQMQSDA